MIWLKNRKGITIIELIISFALISTILVAGYGLFSSVVNNFGRQIDNVDNQTRARQAIRHIFGEIRKADVIELKDEHSIKIDGTQYSFDGDSNTILKDGNDFIVGIKSFKTELIDGEILLEITTLANNDKEFTLSSSIFIRE